MIANIKIKELNKINKENQQFLAYDNGQEIELYFTNNTPIIFRCLLRKDKDKKYKDFLSRIKFVVIQNRLD